MGNMTYYGTPTPWSGGANAFVQSMLKAYQDVRGVGLKEEALAEEQRQAMEREKYQQALAEQAQAQTEAVQNSVARQRLASQALQKLYANYQPTLPPAGLEGQVATGQPSSAEVYQALVQSGGMTVPEAIQAAEGMNRLGLTRAQQAHLEAQTGAIPAETEKTRAQTEAYKAQSTLGIPSEAAYHWARAMSVMNKEPKLEHLSPDIKTFLGSWFPKIFTDPTELPKAIEYFNSPEGQQNWAQFFTWLKKPEQILPLTNSGTLAIPPQRVPGVPGTGGQPPAPGPTPGLPASPRMARQVMGPEGQPVGKPIPPEAMQGLTFLSDIVDSYKEAEKLLQKYPDVTGKGPAIWSYLANTVPFLEPNKKFEAVKPVMGMLMDIVYAKSGKQINKEEREWMQQYIPLGSDKPEVVDAKMRALQRHLFSLIYNRAKNLDENGYPLPPNFKQLLAHAEDYFQRTGTKPLAGFGLRAVTEEGGYKPVGNPIIPKEISTEKPLTVKGGSKKASVLRWDPKSNRFVIGE